MQLAKSDSYMVSCFEVEHESHCRVLDSICNGGSVAAAGDDRRVQRCSSLVATAQELRDQWCRDILAELLAFSSEKT